MIVRGATLADLPAVAAIYAAAAESSHATFDFAEVGTFHGVGVKFGREWDVRWFERPLRR
jgi:phosphinothricin acetyltransferase